MKQYRRCPREYQYRYGMGIVANSHDREALDFGSLVHDGLEAYLNSGSIDEALKVVDECAAKAWADDQDKARDSRCRAYAMIQAYANKYPSNEDGFEVVACEVEFAALPMVNPDTGKKSRTFVNAGKIDAVFRNRASGFLWLVEHKTASRVDENYFDKLSMDMQINRYARVVQQRYGSPVEGVLYNVLTKCKLKRKEGESPADFEERVEKAATNLKPIKQKEATKNKPAETDEEFAARNAEREEKARQKVRDEGPRKEESWEDFADRVWQWYQDNPDAVQRREIILTKDSIEECQRIEWQTAKRIREDMAANNGKGCFPKNPDACERYGRMCQYFRICSSRYPEAVIENEFHFEEPNKELSNHGIISTTNSSVQTATESELMDDNTARSAGSGEVKFPF
jgi:hypothetical protein